MSDTPMARTAIWSWSRRRSSSRNSSSTRLWGVLPKRSIRRSQSWRFGHDRNRSMTPTPARDYPRIVVPPPGPKARAIVARQDRFASTSYPKEYPLAVARGERAVVEDVDGNRFLDFMAGLPGRAPGYGAPPRAQGGQDAAGPVLPNLR